MRILQQRNVYYVDLSKSVYRGYVESSIVRAPDECSVVYQSAHLGIEEIEIAGVDGGIFPG